MSRKNLVSCLLGLAILGGGCSHSTPSPSASFEQHPTAEKTGAPRPGALTRETAILRSKQVAHLSYALWFEVDDQHDDFEGRAVINFDLKSKAKEYSPNLALDFEGGIIKSIAINGTLLNSPFPPERQDAQRIYFKLSELLPGSNRLEIAFSHPFSQDGEGLHRFKDPVDGQVYIYSQSEPFSAHRFFPCFDQPDLKASFELTVETPENWVVISNTLEREAVTVDGRKSWAFPPSPVLSTYVFALIAGPYRSWKSGADGIPIRLFARKSMASYVDWKEWFDITRKGLDFFATEFGYPYPFGKYDQILVPQFNGGAMENAGAVTFSERYIFRGKVTQNVRQERTDTILHEMAHMWFGDLVTMKWWNGLWLNESFATLMASVAVESLTKSSDPWKIFFSDEKRGAYWQDQLVVTHPVDSPVPDTDAALAGFDEITYGKGASALKQLRFYLGEEDFREGVQRYFMKYAFQNTTLLDFFHMLAEASGKDLTQWYKSWILTAGLNTVRADWKCENGKISEFNLIQGPGDQVPLLRSHRTRLALYRYKGGAFQKPDIIGFTYSGASNPVSEALGKNCPDFVFPNHQDEDYIKVELDQRSLEVVRSHLSKLKEPLTRHMVWLSLWEQVRDGKIKVQDFYEVALTQLKNETDIELLKGAVARLEQGIAYLPPEVRFEFREKFEKFSFRRLQASSPGSDLQIIWQNAHTRFAFSEPALTRIRGLLSGKVKVSGLKIDLPMRWRLIGALASNGAEDAQTLVSEQLAKDPTEAGERLAIRVEASIPNSQIKKKWLDEILARKLPVSKLVTAMHSYQDIWREDFTRSWVVPFFETIPKLDESSGDTYLDTFASEMFPSLCENAIIDRTSQTLSAHPDLPIQISKGLRIAKQEEERCVRARALAAAPASQEKLSDDSESRGVKPASIAP